MSGVQKLTIADHDAGQRLDRWFKRQFPHIPHGKVEKLLRKGEIRLDGKRAKGNARIEVGKLFVCRHCLARRICRVLNLCQRPMRPLFAGW